MDVDGARLSRVCEAPDVLEELVAGQHGARLPAERLEQLELLRPEGDRLSVDDHLVSLRIERQVPDLERPPAAAAGRPAHHRVHARHELARVERLHQVVIEAGVEPRDLLDVLGARGERDDRRVVRAPQLGEEIQAVRVGQPEVEHHARRRASREGLTRLGRGRAVLDHEAGVLEVQGHELGDGGIIFDDHDARPAHSRMLGPAFVRAGR